MRVALVSDLHLAARSGADVARQPAALEALGEELAAADQVVILGDLLELREQPVARVLEAARPVLEAIGAAASGRPLTLVPGNHDHALAAPYLERLRVDGQPLGLEESWPVRAGDGLAGRVAELMGLDELVLAYPGLRPRPDVYATHGHYLDAQLTVPRLESIAVAALGRVLRRRRGDCRAPSDYEALLAPLYAFHHALAESAQPELLRRGGGLSRDVWGRLDGHGSSPLGRFLLGRVTIPGGVAALNGLGLGPFSARLSGPELRRAGLDAMRAVARSLGAAADHVVFGHTHRPGPLPGDDVSEWSAPGGGQLWNTGSWYHESVLLRDRGAGSPYWPGTVVRLEDEGPPQPARLLEDVPLRAPARR